MLTFTKQILVKKGDNYVILLIMNPKAMVVCLDFFSFIQVALKWSCFVLHVLFDFFITI